DRIVIIIKLTWVEIGPGEAIVFGPVVPVVLMGRDRMAPKAAVLRDIGGQHVVGGGEGGLTITANKGLGRDGAVERPHAVWVLDRQILVELQRDVLSGVDAGVEVRGNPGVVGHVGLSPFL